VKTVTELPFDIFNINSCETLVLDSTFSRQIELLFGFFLMRCSWQTTIVGVMITNLILLSACLAVGTYGWQVIYHCLLHLGVGCVIAYSCHVHTQESRNQFAKVKHVKLAAKQRRSVLYTLIPPNVLGAVAKHSPDLGLLAVDIPQCTIMFCSLTRALDGQHANMTDAQDFRVLHAVCLDFDDAVKCSGLYKYQHVGSWYIVTCLKAAAPFEAHASNTHYKSTSQVRFQASYATEVGELARHLMSLARHHGFDLQVGIHTGSAAGAVIGSLRAFYCIYGQTVNTASRLCKYAERGQICCSQDFVTCLNKEQAARTQFDTRSLIRFTPCGIVLMKGLEPLEVFIMPVVGGVVSPPCAMNPDIPESFNADGFSMSPTMKQKRGGVMRQGRLRQRRMSLRDMLRDKDLSDESLAFLKNRRLKNSKHFACFDDDSTEEHYRQYFVRRLQRRVSAGIALHLLGIIFQLHMILYPEFSYDFEILGPTLAYAYTSVAELLHQYLALQCLLCLGLSLAIFKGPVQWTENISIMLGVLRLSWLPFSMYLSTIWPVRQYTLVFPSLYSMLHFMHMSLSFRNMIVFFVLHVSMYLIMLIPIRNMIPKVFISRLFITLVGIFMLNLWFSDVNRLRWRLHRVFEYEMRLFEDMLHDLLPMTGTIASCSSGAGDYSSVCNFGKTKAPQQNVSYDNYLCDNSLPVYLERAAIVLQLDLCGFTEFSQNMSPIELADTMHEIFSQFDSTVRGLNLFKMDTVGDAYIVAAWLTPDEAGGASRASTESTGVRNLCHSIMWLAGMMLNTLDSHRKQGHRLSARIGVAVGQVVVGSLGSMQARIHIRGYGMRKAEQLEQQGLSCQAQTVIHAKAIFNILVTNQIRKHQCMT
jgi:class 3 adenylate cyclase